MNDDFFSFEPPAHWLIAGTTRSGKSFFAGYLAEKAISEEKALLIFDPKNENLNGLAELKDVYPFMILPESVKHIKEIETEILRLLQMKKCVIVYPSKSLTGDHFKEYEERIMTYVFENLDKKFPVIVILDECRRHLLHSNPTEIFMRLITTGLGDNKSLIMVTQRTNQMHPDVLSECHKMSIFKLNRTLDIDYLGKESDALQFGLEKLPTLPKYYHVYYDLNSDSVYVVAPAERQTTHRG